MTEKADIDNIKAIVEHLLEKMTVVGASVEVNISAAEMVTKKLDVDIPARENVEVNIQLAEPQFLIGQYGQALHEFQHIVRIIANKKLQKPLYIKVDINDYRKKKVEYVKHLALNLASEAVSTKEERILPSMSSYERMMVHSALAGRSDVTTESRGSGSERYVVIRPV